VHLLGRTALAACVALALFQTPITRGDDYAPPRVFAVELADGVDSSEVSAELVATYGGRLQLYAAVGFHGFAAALTEESARQLSADPRVKSVSALTTAAPPPPASGRPRAVSEYVPSQWTTGTYTYDASGNIVSIGPSSDQKSDLYAYDATSRLVDATANNARSDNRQQFTYDAFGNLIQVTSSDAPGNPLNIPVDSATNRIKDSGSGATGSYALATYDEAGNQISFNASYFYGYDGFNMMNELKSGSRDDLYVYDGDDERIAVVSLNGATSDDAVWSYTFRDLTGKVLRSAEDSVQGGTHHWQWKKDYVYAEGSLIAAVLPQGSGEQRRHFHLDHLGSVRLTTDEGGRRMSLHTYWPYGQEAPGSDADDEAIKFAGMERDLTDRNGLDYAQARYHGPVTGRFLSLDRQGGQPADPLSLNRYAYSRGNPLKLVDPNGQKFVVSNDADRTFFAGLMVEASKNRDVRQIIQLLASDPHPYELSRGKNIVGVMAEYTGRDPKHPDESYAAISFDEGQRAARAANDVNPANRNRFSPTVTFIHEMGHIFDFFYAGGLINWMYGDPTTTLTSPIRNTSEVPNIFERWAEDAAVNQNDVNNAFSLSDARSLIVYLPVPEVQDDPAACEKLSVCYNQSPPEN